MSECKLCGKDKETRPYGRGGMQICFDCAMATPSTKAQTERAFVAQLNHARSASNVVVLGEDCGPYPLGGNRQ